MHHHDQPGSGGVRGGVVRLRLTRPDDLPAMFEMQADAASNDMAGTKPRTREAFMAAWERNFADPGVNARVIEIEGDGGSFVLVGSIARFQVVGEDHIGYWIARAQWGRGIASRALALFLAEEARRPLHATTDRDNAASRHILEKCGFRCVGFRTSEETDRYLAREVAEFVLD